MKISTIRKLLTVAVTQAFQQEHLIKSEVDELVEHILNNSTISVALDDNIDLKEGNCFGIGETNKDKELEVQKYYVFSFTRTRIVDFHSSWVQAVNMTRSWRFVSMPDFQRLEDYIRSNSDDNTYIAVLLDAEPLDFTVIRNTEVVDDIWTPKCKDVQWEKSVYKLSYKQNGRGQDETFNSKVSLENRMLQLISVNAEKLRVFNLIDGNKHLGFRVTGNVYQSGGKPEVTERNVSIIWNSPYSWE
ncbi:MAG: hypothetical protein ACERKN_21570 [Velocimicrobium sp.]